MVCNHNFQIEWYRITWSGKFKLVIEKCSFCNHTRSRTIEFLAKSSFPSRAWKCCQV